MTGLEDLALVAAEHGGAAIVQVGGRPHFHMISCDDVLAIARGMAALEVRRLSLEVEALMLLVDPRPRIDSPTQ